jgi:protein TonB
MELKKNPKADIRRNSSLYFAIGLAIVTLVSWRALE